MKWTEPQKPNDEVAYTHMIADTPIGRMIIYWEGWKEYPDYNISIGTIWVDIDDDLDAAKEIGKQYIETVHAKLTEYLKDDSSTTN